MTLENFFSDCKRNNKKIALAFSGGVDSTYLLYAGIKSGCAIKAYYVKSQFQPQFEFEDAIQLSKELNADLKIINVSVLDYSQICENTNRRCYFCKKIIFQTILDAAKEDGCDIILDGTNASDDISDRPGFQALQEMKVMSPLRDSGLTKNEIRWLSKEAGLWTWNKPAYACLATRIPTGTFITKEDLEITEKSEAIMMEMGFTNFRIRKNGTTAKIQVPEEQIEKVIKEKNILIEKLKPMYENITLDLETRNS